MKKYREGILYGLWILMYIGAVLLSLVDVPVGTKPIFLWIYGCLFFVPGGFLVAWALMENSKPKLRRLRLISGISLGLTLVLLVANFMSAAGSAQLGRILNSFLILVSAPMLITYNWAISLFLWACIMMCTFPRLVLPRKK